MKKYKSVFIYACLLLPAIICPVFPSFSETLSGVEIVKKMEQNMRGESSYGKASMSIKTPGWSRHIEMDFWMSGKDNTLIKIVAPAKEAGQATLKRGSLIWFYHPNVEQEMKINHSMMMQPWMGSDFTYDDMMKATTLVDDYSHRVAGTETLEGKDCWIIESLPAPGVPVVWGKQVFLVGRDYLPMRQEFYDEKGRLVKILEFSELKSMGGKMFPSEWKMTSVRKQETYTILKYHKIKFDSPIKKDIFSLRSLKK